MSIDDLTDEDRAAMTDALRAWKKSGTANPLIPLDVDLDGDGIVDSIGLDPDGNLTIVSADLGSTVYVSQGDDMGATEE